jgi:hypothetical protein
VYVGDERALQGDGRIPADEVLGDDSGTAAYFLFYSREEGVAGGEEGFAEQGGGEGVERECKNETVS